MECGVIPGASIHISLAISETESGNGRQHKAEYCALIPIHGFTVD